ncbi:MAG: MFS transporter [Verrucomicrobiota bacterium]
MSERVSHTDLKKPGWAQTISWAFYDWANTGYSMIVLALIFPRLYKGYFGSQLSDDQQTFWFTMTVSVASVCVAVLAPFLGSFGELGGLRKRLLLRFCAIGVVATGACYLVGKDQYELASLVYIVGTVSFYSANLFSDSLLAKVSTKENRHLVSGLGFSFGYTAGFLLLAITVVLTTKAEEFGFSDVGDASRAMFIVAAIWWAVFSLPLAWKIREKPRADRPSTIAMARQSATNTWQTLKEVVSHKPVLWFLVAYLFYIDGVNTIITTASNYGATVGFTQNQIIVGFFIVQIFGVPCAILFGLLGNKIGPRRMIYVAMGIYLVVTIYGALIETEPVVVFGISISEMYILAAMIGMVQGGIQALSRSYFNSLIPVGREVSFFGFYSMIGKSAAILGPILIGSVALLFNNPESPAFSTRLGMGSVSILFVVGAIFLLKAGRAEQRASTES